MDICVNTKHEKHNDTEKLNINGVLIFGCYICIKISFYAYSKYKIIPNTTCKQYTVI